MPCYYCRGEREGTFKRGQHWCCERCDERLDEFNNWAQAGQFVLPWNRD